MIDQKYLPTAGRQRTFPAVFTCRAIANGEKYLSEHLTANDYYCEKERVSGQWVGKGAEALNLTGPIDGNDRAFELLRRNRDPKTGELLTQRDSRKIAFYDFQCSAPKSVSILAVTYSDTRLAEAHRASVKIAFAELEKHAARRYRTGAAAFSKESLTTGNVVAAMFHHDASRALDAQLHTHCVTINATVDGGKWYALDNTQMFKAIEFGGRVYQNELARRCQELGYDVREDRRDGKLHGFEIVGVSDDEMRRQSVRRQQIDAGIEAFQAEKGRRPTHDEIGVITRQTRGPKLIEITTEAVRQRQRDLYTSDEQERHTKLIDDAKHRAGEGSTAARSDERQVIAWAAEHVFERKAVASRMDLLTIALRENLGKLDLGALRGALEKAQDVIHLVDGGARRPDDTRSVTSREQLAREQRSIAWVNDSKGRFAPLAPQCDGLQGLGEDQVDAVRLLARSRDGVMWLRGPAGTGKTTTLQALETVVRAAGHDTIHVAPSHQAKNVLQSDGFSYADTVSMLLVDAKAGRVGLSGKLLVVDEAGMLGFKQADELRAVATAAGCRVLLVGDEKQLLSVEAGDWLGFLRDHSRIVAAELHEIRRQKERRYREAMRAMSEGRVADGLTILDEEGHVKEGKADYLRNATVSFMAKLAGGESAILVAPTWAEIDRLNASVRDIRRSSGELGGESQTVRAMDVVDNLTEAQRTTASSYTPGMFVAAPRAFTKRGLERGKWYEIEAVDTSTKELVVRGAGRVPLKNAGKLSVARAVDLELRLGERLLLHANDRKLGVYNGDFVRLCGFGGDGALEVERERDSRRVRLPADYRTFLYGYAVTAERSQGATVTHAIVAAEWLDPRRTYVASSRGRRSVELHLPDKTHVLDRAQNKIERLRAGSDYQELDRAARIRAKRERLTAWHRWFGVLRTQIRRTHDFTQRQVIPNIQRAFSRGHST